MAANWEELILSTLSDKTGGRFNPPGSFPMLYTSGDPHTALEEATHAMKKAGFDPRKSFPRTTHVIQIKLTRVINLYDSKVLRELELTKEQLRIQNWQMEQLAGRQPITQTIGLLIHEPGTEPLLFSLKGEPGLLVAFTADTMHEVRPVARGERFTIISWFR